MENLDKKTESELQGLLGQKRVALREVRFGIAHSKHKNTMESRDIKKDIARINTALKSKSIKS